MIVNNSVVFTKDWSYRFTVVCLPGAEMEKNTLEVKSLFVRTLKGACHNNILRGPMGDTLISQRVNQSSFLILPFPFCLPE